MTAWEHHHPPHDHPYFDAHLDTLTDDDFDAINANIDAVHRPLDTINTNEI
jgi:hypothetical protein